MGATAPFFVMKGTYNKFIGRFSGDACLFVSNLTLGATHDIHRHIDLQYPSPTDYKRFEAWKKYPSPPTTCLLLPWMILQFTHICKEQYLPKGKKITSGG